VFFSISTGKRDIYVLPAFPAAALLVGRIWSCWWVAASDGLDRWARRIPAVILALGMLGLAVGIGGAAGEFLPNRNTLLLPRASELRFWICLALVVMATLIGTAALAMRARLVYVSIVGCTWLAMLITVEWVYTPQFNERYPIKAFAAGVNAEVTPNGPLQLCGPLNDLALRLNLGRFVPALPEISEVAHYLTRDREAFCVIEAQAYQQLNALTGQSFPIVARQAFDQAPLLLITNRRR
jgi:4-amino-4-deoxy-L-arabinose transferase-like glycosyltransferase